MTTSDHNQQKCGCDVADAAERLRRALRGESGRVSLTGNSSEVDYYMQTFAGVRCSTAGCLNSGRERVSGLHLGKQAVIVLRVCSPCSVPLLANIEKSYVKLPGGATLPVWPEQTK